MGVWIPHGLTDILNDRKRKVGDLGKILSTISGNGIDYCELGRNEESSRTFDHRTEKTCTYS